MFYAQPLLRNRIHLRAGGTGNERDRKTEKKDRLLLNTFCIGFILIQFKHIIYANTECLISYINTCCIFIKIKSTFWKIIETETLYFNYIINRIYL